MKFDDSKNTYVNQRKSKHCEKLNFTHEKIEKNVTSKKELKTRPEALIHCFVPIASFSISSIFLKEEPYSYFSIYKLFRK